MTHFARLLLGLLAAGLAFGWAGWLGAIRDPAITRYRLVMPGLHRPLRIVHLSDTHGSRWDMPPQRLARIVAMANAQAPDIVVLTGDYHASKAYWNPPMRLEDSLLPLSRLSAPLGVWSVNGNHDQPYWTPRVMNRFGVSMLLGHWVDVGPVRLLGCDDLINMPASASTCRQAAALAPRDKPMIALVHEPTLWLMLPPQVDLLLAGHTHGGQFPAWMRPRLNDVYERHLRGLFGNGRGQRMIVSAGIGTSVVPLRLVRAEIVVIDLVPPQPPGRNSGTDR